MKNTLIIKIGGESRSVHLFYSCKYLSEKHWHVKEDNGKLHMDFLMFKIYFYVMSVLNLPNCIRGPLSHDIPFPRIWNWEDLELGRSGGTYIAYSVGQGPFKSIRTMYLYRTLTIGQDKVPVYL